MCYAFFRRFWKLMLKLFSVIFIVWIFFNYRQVLPPFFFLSKILLENYNTSIGFYKHLPAKYLLLWSKCDYRPFKVLRQKGIFTKYNCSFQNCIVTSNRNYFRDLSWFDAIALHGAKVTKYRSASDNRPRATHMSLHQKYVYINLESAHITPVCSLKFDHLFNWTMTYKLNSDVPLPYIQIRDKSGNVVGPKINMHWKENTDDFDNEVLRLLKNKTKAVAWFPSKCDSVSLREILANALHQQLESYGYSVDVYGKCGRLKCGSDDDCNSLLKNNYYFYLAYEESIAEDYVTDEILRPLQHYAVPIVFGGANYSRFLPPRSYLNARDSVPSRLASTMVKLMKNINLYYRYFTWRQHYTYHNPITDNVCAVCAALNDPKLAQRTEYPDLRRWWNTPPPTRCPNKKKVKEEEEKEEGRKSIEIELT